MKRKDYGTVSSRKRLTVDSLLIVVYLIKKAGRFILRLTDLSNDDFKYYPKMPPFLSVTAPSPILKPFW